MIDCGITFADDTVPGVDIVMADPAFIAERGRAGRPRLHPRA